MTNCQICRKDIKKQKYSCWKQTKFYCKSCRITFCRTCLQVPLACKKQKGYTFNRKLLTCTVCKVNKSQTQYQFFNQPKCLYDFCCQCLNPLYEAYFKSMEQIQAQEGVRLQFPFQVPCGCQLSQKQILEFLQKSCYCCNIKIESQQTYRLNNNLRIMKNCFEQKQKKQVGQQVKIKL